MSEVPVLPAAIDFSIYGTFLQASGVVQAVVVLLVLASVVCWAIIIEKALLMVHLQRQLHLLEGVTHAETLSAPESGTGHLATAILGEGRHEWAVEKTGERVAERRDRAETAMREVMLSEILRAESRLPYLATIASAAPFIGLFGTVWGIMHAFTGIAQTNDTSLATVAPGIAEALAATAVGLFAAIPASVGYNKIASDFGALARRLTLLISKLARRLDEAGESGPTA